MILFVDACARPNSRTRELAFQVLGAMNDDVEQVCLYEEKISPLDLPLLEERDRLSVSGDFSGEVFRYARQFAAADTIVIAAPYWDLLFPAILRCYLEAVTVTGVTFRYTEQGIPASMCRAKKLIYVTTAGGFIGEYNFGFNYIKALAQTFFGISDVRCFTAEGLDIVGADVLAIMKEAKRKVEDSVRA